MKLLFIAILFGGTMTFCHVAKANIQDENWDGHWKNLTATGSSKGHDGFIPDSLLETESDITDKESKK
jgi:hypothetical protein